MYHITPVYRIKYFAVFIICDKITYYLLYIYLYIVYIYSIYTYTYIYIYMIYKYDKHIIRIYS